MGFYVLLVLLSCGVFAVESHSLAHGESLSLTNQEIPFHESVEVSAQDPAAIVEMFLIHGTESRASSEDLSHFLVYSGSQQIASLDQIPSNASSLTPIRSIEGSHSLTVLNRLQNHTFAFQLFFRVLSDSQPGCSRVIQSTILSANFSAPDNASCALTILSISEGGIPAGVVFNSLTMEGNGTATVVPGVDFATTNYFFRFTKATEWGELNVFGKAISIVLPPGSTVRVSMVDGGVDLKDEIEVRNDEGFLTNPDYPQPVDAPANFTTQLKFPPTAKIEISLVDADFASPSTSLTIGNMRFAGNQTGKVSTFATSPLAIRFVQGDPQSSGFLLRYSVTGGASTSERSLRCAFIPFVFIVIINGY